MCYDSDITEYDRRTPELSIAPLHMKKNSSSIEIKPHIDPSN